MHQMNARLSAMPPDPCKHTDIPISGSDFPLALRQADYDMIQTHSSVVRSSLRISFLDEREMEAPKLGFLRHSVVHNICQ